VNQPNPNHVTKPQIEALERGEVVALNSGQLDNLYEHAPHWVAIYVGKIARADGLHDVVIKDTRPNMVDAATMAQIKQQIAKDMKAYGQEKK
jgi:hypothetical protein